MKQQLLLLSALAFTAISHAQNVGIGTETPAEKLEVNGNIRLSFGTHKTIGVTSANNAGVSGHNLSLHAGSAIFSQSAAAGGNLELFAGNSNDAGAQAGGNIVLTAGRNYYTIPGNPSSRHGDIIIMGWSVVNSGQQVELGRVHGTTGNWGFGTATPTARLDVVGTVKTTGLQLTTGATAGFVMTSDANGVASWANASGLTITESDPQVGANTLNQLSKWDGNALVTSGIFESAGNVGIGTNAPGKRLDVAGTGGLRVNSTNPGTGTADWISGNFGGTAGDRVVMGNQSSVATIGAHNNALNAWANLSINSGGGNVGIGVLAPHATLHLSNSISNRRLILWEDANNDHQFYGMGMNASTLRFQVPATNTNYGFYAGTGSGTSNEVMRIQGNGDVSIGAGAAAAKLDVKGNFKMGNSGSVLNNIIKFSIGFGAVNVPANNTNFVTISPVGGAVKNSTVFVSPSQPLPAGVSIGFARVPVDGTVEVFFVNGSGVNQNTPVMDVHITIIN